MSGPVQYSDLFDGLGLGSQELLDFTKSVQGLNRNYKAFAKSLDKDAERIAAGLAAIQDSATGLRTQIANTSVGTDQQRNQIAKLSQQVAQLVADQNSYKKALEGQNTVRRTTKQATDELTKSLREQQEALKKAYAEGNIEGARKAALEVMSLTRQSNELQKALRGATSDITAVSGSYNRLALDTKLLGDQIRALPGGFDSADAAAQALKKQFYENTQQLKDFDRELNQNFREVGSYAKGILEAVAALNKQEKSLQDNLFALQLQSRATGLTAEQQNKLQKEIRETEEELAKVNGQLKSYGVQSKQANGFTASLQQGAGGLVQSFAGAYYGVQGLATAMQQLFEKNVEYSDQAADVRKATGQSAEEFEQLANALKSVDTRTSLAGQLDIAKVGGQLGKAKDEIEGFTRAIDVAVQALEDDFSGGASEIATQLGKIELVFRKTLGPDQNQNLLNIGSAINQLGAEGAATAPYLAEVALRVGSAAANAKLGLKDVLAYAAVLQETGSTAEVSGSALNRLFSTLSTRTKESFEIARLADANLTLKQFKHLVNNDFQGAINLFLRGLNTGGTSTTRFNSLLATLKLQSGEAKNAITTLAKNTDLFAERQKSANSQLKEGTSLAEEAALKNNNLAGSWEKTKNSVVSFATNGVIASVLQDLLDDTRHRIQILTDGLGLLGDGITFLGRKVGAIKPPTVDSFGTFAGGTKVLLNQATAAEKLLQTYKDLAAVQGRSSEQELQMADAALKLQKSLGATLGELDKQTGEFKLNTGAVEDAIFARRRLAAENEKTLVKGLRNAEAAVAATQKLQARLSEQIGTAQAKLDLGGMSAERRKELEQAVRDRQGLRDKFAKIGIKQVDSQGTQGFSQKEIDAAQTLIDAEIRLRENGELLKKQQRDVANAQAALNSVRKAGTQVVKDDTVAVDDSIEKEKEKKKAIADVAKAEYELAKQRLEEKLADYQRQQENPANTEEIRLRAAQKAAGVRRELAQLERDELIREAAQTYKDQINGQQALGVARVRLQEAFKTQLLTIDRELSKEELAIRNALLDKLGEVEQLQLEQEIENLDLIATDEARSYQERQQAALDAAARRLELIELEGQAQVRAARGNAEELAKIEKQLEQKRQQALRQPKPFNAEFANDDALKGYERQQLALERRRAGGLVGERQYQRELVRLENEYLDTKLGNLQKDSTKQREAAQLELEIARRKNQQKLEDEREHQRLRGELIQEGLQNVQQLSDSFFEIGAQRRQAELQNLQLTKDAELKIAGESDDRQYLESKAKLEQNRATALAAAGADANKKKQVEEQYARDSIAVEAQKNNLKSQIEENFRRRELAIRQKQAKADRNQALFNVALNTAQAVTSVLSTGGGTRYADFGISAGILTALVIGQGLAQSAAILSRPLPQYAKGRTGGPAEWALVGERGPELVSTPSGNAHLFSGPTITYLPQGADVHTAMQTQDILRNNRFVENRLITHRYQQDLADRTRAIERPGRPQPSAGFHITEATNKLGDRLISAWHERPEQRLTERGLETFTRRGEQTTRHTTRRYRRNS